MRLVIEEFRIHDVKGGETLPPERHTVIAVPVTDDVPLITIERMVEGTLALPATSRRLDARLLVVVPVVGPRGTTEEPVLLIEAVHQLAPRQVARFVRAFVAGRRDGAEEPAAE